MIHYKYRGTDPQHSDNRALRMAMDEGLPLAYLYGIGKGLYLPIFPVYLLQEIPERHEFVVGFESSISSANPIFKESLERNYVDRLTKTRMHQPGITHQTRHGTLLNNAAFNIAEFPGPIGSNFTNFE